MSRSCEARRRWTMIRPIAAGSGLERRDFGPPGLDRRRAERRDLRLLLSSRRVWRGAAVLPRSGGRQFDWCTGLHACQRRIAIKDDGRRSECTLGTVPRSTAPFAQQRAYMRRLPFVAWHCLPFLPRICRRSSGRQARRNYAVNGFPAPGTAPYHNFGRGHQKRATECAAAAIWRADAAATPAHLQDTSATAPAQKADLGAEAVERRTGVKIIRAGGGAAPEALIIDVAKALNAGLPAAPDPRLIEQTPHGPIPRIGADGARPSEVYARPTAMSSGGLTRRAAHCFAHWWHGSCSRAQRNRRSQICRAPSRSASLPMEPILRAKRRARARQATRSSCKFRWSPSISRATIPARTRFSRAPGKPRISTILPG